MFPLSIADHILFALLAFVLPLFFVWRNQPGQIMIPDDSRIKIRIYWVNSLILWVGAMIVIALWLFQRRDFYDLGFRLPVIESFPHWLLLVAGFLVLYFTDAMLSWNSDDSQPAAAILPASWREFMHFGTVVSISAACCEEIVFRGFVVNYLLTFMDGHPNAIAIAVLGSALVFGIVHIYQGVPALLKITVLSTLFAWLFILTKSLLLVMLLHFVVDFCSGMLAVVRTKEEESLLRRYL